MNKRLLELQGNAESRAGQEPQKVFTETNQNSAGVF